MHPSNEDRRKNKVAPQSWKSCSAANACVVPASTQLRRQRKNIMQFAFHVIY